MSTKLDISQIELSKLKNRPFHIEVDYRISISKEAYELIHQHATENTNIELCGILVGEVLKDNNKPYLEITNAIRGEYAKNEGTQVTFTHETWAHIHKVKDAEFPDKQIVGWYHTHPGFGIFLSSHDTFIHENFFNQPWHSAFVIDPISNDEGFFIWKEGKPIQMETFWIAGELKTTPINPDDLEIDKAKIKDAEKDNVANRNNKTNPLYSLALILITVLLAFLLIYIIRFNNRTYDLLIKINSDLDNKSQTLVLDEPEGKSVNIDLIKSALQGNPSINNLNIQLIQSGNHIQCIGIISTIYQKELIGQTIKSVAGVESVDVQDLIVTGFYTTQPDDNLSEIAEKLYGNSKLWIPIFNKNKDQIEDPNLILPFTKLSLPEEL